MREKKWKIDEKKRNEHFANIGHTEDVFTFYLILFKWLNGHWIIVKNVFIIEISSSRIENSYGSRMKM